MSSEKYPVGQKLIINSPAGNAVVGTVVENCKMPGDICIKWEGLEDIYSYDEEFLDENAEVLKEKE